MIDFLYNLGRRVAAGRGLTEEFLRAQHLWKKGKISKLRAKLIQKKIQQKFGCHISLEANSSEDLEIIHPVAVVIGEGVIIGGNVKIYQSVTIGSKSRGGNAAYPVIEDNVVIFSGAAILGGVTIGKGSVVGANSVVLESIPAYSTAVGMPAKVLNQ